MARLSRYSRYRKILSGTNLGGPEVDCALDALRPRIAPPQSLTAVASPTRQFVMQALRYGTTGRPEQEFLAVGTPPQRSPRRPRRGPSHWVPRLPDWAADNGIDTENQPDYRDLCDVRWRPRTSTINPKDE